MNPVDGQQTPATVEGGRMEEAGVAETAVALALTPAGVPPLRTHQARALTALDAVWDADRRRAWVVLPPGAGKTRVGLETIAAALGDGTATHVVVLAPNTAIQAQWVAAAAAHQFSAGTSRDLAATVTCLTYQALAVFDADDEVADDPDETPAPSTAPCSTGSTATAPSWSRTSAKCLRTAPRAG